MTNQLINLERTAEVAAKVVNERPLHIDTISHHRDPDDPQQPGCLVGVVFDRLGLLDRLVPIDAWEYGPPDEDGISDLDAETYFTPGAIRFLSELQTRQDDGAPWIVALVAAAQEVGQEGRLQVTVTTTA